MAELRKADAERLLEFVGDAHSVDGPEPFTTELLDRLTERCGQSSPRTSSSLPNRRLAQPLVTINRLGRSNYVTPTLIRNAHARRHFADLRGIADAVDDGESSGGYVLLRGGLEVAHASSAARRILGSCFDSRASRLPSLLEECLRSGEGGKPLRLERNGTRLTVEAPASRALVFTE